ncbi:MAG: metallophosphoesterase [Thermoguttaceae bacterium]|nr:metallophosphoesterase [Thermoguttaceae bacterium]
MLTRRSFVKTLSLSALAPAGLSALTASETPASPALELKPLRLAQYCDPQLGFGEEGFGESLTRFHKAIDLINDLNPDVVTVLGDLVHRYEDPADEMINGLKRIKPQLIVAPGNHDIPEPVTPEKLTRFRNDYGPDRQSALINGWKLICVNTQLWRGAEPEETAAQDEWFSKELGQAKEKGIPSIILSHIPPYIAYPNEDDSWAAITNENELRKNLIVKAVENGARFWLAGHTHETIVRVFEGMLIMNGETTSVNFDKRPYGIRLLTVQPSGDYTWDFIKVG